jgi:hypothetical protein
MSTHTQASACVPTMYLAKQYEMGGASSAFRRVRPNHADHGYLARIGGLHRENAHVSDVASSMYAAAVASYFNYSPYEHLDVERASGSYLSWSPMLTHGRSFPSPSSSRRGIKRTASSRESAARKSIPSSSSSSSSSSGSMAKRSRGMGRYVRKEGHVYKFECDECDYCTDVSGSMKRHRRAVHEKYRKDSPSCPSSRQDPTRTTSSRKSAAHKASSSSSSSSPPSSSSSITSDRSRRGGKFVRKEGYLYRFECNYECDYGTDIPGSMKRHVEGVHEKRKDYECPVCHKRFAHAHRLKTHREAKH